MNAKWAEGNFSANCLIILHYFILYVGWLQNISAIYFCVEVNIFVFYIFIVFLYHSNICLLIFYFYFILEIEEGIEREGKRIIDVRKKNQWVACLPYISWPRIKPKTLLVYETKLQPTKPPSHGNVNTFKCNFYFNCNRHTYRNSNK